MTDVTHAVRYLEPAADVGWTWADEGEAMEWCAGSTIAFREQLMACVVALPDDTLPPVDLLVLLLAACRDTWQEDRRQHEQSLPDPPLGIRDVRREFLAAMDTVHQLSAEIRRQPVDIVRVLFEDHPFAAGDRADVLVVLSCRQWRRDEPHDPAAWSTLYEKRTLSWLQRQLSELTEERILQRRRTGLDQLPEPGIEVTLPEVPARSVWQLIQDLQDDDEYGSLMRLARRVMAGLTLPQDVSHPEELPQGGVSDISNRGQLDQLLLSELAHDDDTLMTRVALNEALYLRREVLPAQPPPQRTLLIDVGLRMWGLPRLWATAVALGLSADRTGIDVPAFRSGPQGLQSVDLTTREGLGQYLEALDYTLDPADSVVEWAGQCDDPGMQRVLITEDVTWDDTVFRRWVSEHVALPCFVVLVNREGRVRLLCRTLIGDRPIRELWLEEERVIPDAEVELTDPSVDPQLPAIMKLRRLPLRLPVPNSRETTVVPLPRSLTEKPHALQVTADRRLLLWDREQCGAGELSHTLPHGTVHWSGRLVSGASVSIVVGRGQIPELSLIHVARDSHHVTRVPLLFPQQDREQEPVLGVASCERFVLTVQKQSVTLFDASTGESVDRLSRDNSSSWIRDRWFRYPSGIRRVAMVNGRLEFETLTVRDTQDIETIVGLADRPQAVCRDGTILDLLEGKRQYVTSRLSWRAIGVLAVSPDGMSFVVGPHEAVPEHSRSRGVSRARVVQFRKDVAADQPVAFSVSDPVPFRRSAEMLLSPASQFTGYPVDRTLFRRPARLAWGNGLCIVSGSGRRLRIGLRKTHPRGLALLDVTPADGRFRDTDRFDRIKGIPESGVRLFQVEWSDGSRAVLDMRGMLHLQSSDPELPELTLILDEHHVSGWCSDGRTWGLPFYLPPAADDQRRIDADDVLLLLIRFVSRLS